MFLFLQTKTLADLLTLQTSVGDAYTRLMSGQTPRVIVDQNGERVEFTATSADKLGAYLTQIALAIQSKQQAPVTLTRPMDFWF
jgi:hypothetical protein